MYGFHLGDWGSYRMTCQKHPFSNLEKKEEKKLPYHVPAQNSLALHILQAELAHVEPPQAGVFLWVRRVVPSVQLVATKHDGLYHVAALRHLAGQTKLLLYRPRQQERQGEGDGGKVKRYKEDKRKGQRGERRKRKDCNYSGKRIRSVIKDHA